MRAHLQGKSGLRALTFLVCLIMTCTCSPVSASDALPDYTLKAALLFNFTKFVSWPANSVTTKQFFDICIMGSDQVLNAFSPFRSEHVNGKKLRVVEVSGQEESLICDVLFIGAAQKNYLSYVMEKIKNRPVLSVSDIERFIERGGIIGLIETKNGMKFEINIDAARRANLRLSSRMLGLAVTVYGDVGAE